MSDDFRAQLVSSTSGITDCGQFELGLLETLFLIIQRPSSIIP